MDLNMKTESERQEAVQGFNHMADYYDEVRPDYPEELIKTIINKANLTASSKVLEIGAGSGKATAQFADYGFEIVCVEPGIDFVEKGKVKFKDKKNITFIASRFEDYSEPPEYFDAIISAQAFHWITQPLGYEKCSRTLKKGGYLAPFWYIDRFGDADLDGELWVIIEKYDGYVSCMPEENYAERVESITSKIVSSGLFSKPEVIHLYKEINYTAEIYFNWMLTGPKELPQRKQECLEELQQLEDKYNGIKRRYTCELYLTQKI